ncbi:MAG: hypothetical protein ACI3WR_01520 [Oscillospiraceae bacterium]
MTEMEAQTTRLQELQKKLARKRKIDAMLDDLRAQAAALEEETAALQEACAAEQADVDRLAEGGSFSSLLYSLLGRLDEKLEKEEAEAYAASMKYETARLQLEEVRRHTDALLREQASYAEVEKEFHAAFAEERQRLSREDPGRGAELLAAESRLAAISVELREVDEALAVGRDVQRALDGIGASLAKAEGWGTWDLLGGGLVSDLVKHSHLDNAQSAIYELQELLRRYRTELSDVTLNADIRLEVGDFLRFADYFFDDIFSGLAVLDRIHSSQQQIAAAHLQVEEVQGRLQELRRSLLEEEERLSRKREELVVQR